MERFAIPGAGALIISDINGETCILTQIRSKPDAPSEEGLFEIPAGKIRAFENIFDTIKREVKEETGLEVIEIAGENLSTIYEGNSYKVLNFKPFSCSQNLSGTYPIMVFVFICKVEGTLLPRSDEARNYKWLSINDVKRLLDTSVNSFYPMHVDTIRNFIKHSEEINAVI